MVVDVGRQSLDADEASDFERDWAHRITLCGDCLTYQQKQPTYKKPKPGPRGECRGMSPASRFALLKRVNSIDWRKAGRCHFITLSYPDHYYGCSCQQLSLHRSLYWREHEKHSEKQVSALWRTEHQVRKTGKWAGYLMPHVHIISMNDPEVDEKSEWEAWMKAIGEIDYANIKVKEMVSPRQVGYYVAKYVGKASPILGIASNLSKIPPGRAWGVLRRKLFPIAEKKEIRCTYSRELERFVAERIKPRPEINEWGNRSFTLLGDKAKKLWDEIVATGVAGGEVE